MAREINRAFDDALAADGVRVILLTGVGRGFCAGAQLSGDIFQGGAKVGDEMRATISPLIAKMRASPLPIVVAVNGPAAGAGVGVALAGDIVFAARSARFVLSFVKLGAVLDGGTSLFLQRAIGVARARALALTGEPLAAATAADWGLIYKCVDDEVLFDEAMADGGETRRRAAARARGDQVPARIRLDGAARGCARTRGGAAIPGVRHRRSERRRRRLQGEARAEILRGDRRKDEVCRSPSDQARTLRRRLPQPDTRP